MFVRVQELFQTWVYCSGGLSQMGQRGDNISLLIAS